MELYKEKLLANYDALTNAETGIDVNHITDYLRRGNAVRQDECEDIHSGRNCRIRAELLIEILLEKDEQAYIYFHQALEDNYPHFVKLLDETSFDECHGTTLSAARRRNITEANSHRSGITRALPAMSTVFIGRESEKQECVGWLQQYNLRQRMYTITGPPGVGKTALIINACHQYLQSLEQPEHTCILFFDLRCIAEVDDFAAEVLVLLQNKPASPFLKFVNTAFHKDLVLVFDNAEDALVQSLKEKFLDFLKRILEANPRVRVMVTSRESIKLLSVDVYEMKLNPLNRTDAASLTDHHIPSLEADLVVRLCELTGYLPLGLHLLAILLQGGDNPGEIISELEKTPGSTLEALQAVEDIPNSSKLVNCFSTSFDRMDDAQRSCMIASSMFPSTFDRQAAQRVFKPALMMTDLKIVPLVKTQKLLRSLVDKSMLMFDEGSRRYSVHPLLRSFCSVVAKDHSEKWNYSDIQSSFCEYYINFAEESTKQYFENEMYHDAYKQFWSERKNIEHAIQLCISSKSRIPLLLGFASLRGVVAYPAVIQFKLLRQVYESLLESLGPHENEERSVLLTALALVAIEIKDFATSWRYVEEADKLQVASHVHDIENKTFCMHTRAKTYAEFGKFKEAEKIAKDSLALSSKHHKERSRLILQGFSVNALAEVYRSQFQHTRDVQIGQRASKEYNRTIQYLDKLVGSHLFHLVVYLRHASLQRDIGDLKGALESVEKAMAVKNIIMGDTTDTSWLAHIYVYVQKKLHDDISAFQSYKTAFEECSQALGQLSNASEDRGKAMEMLRKL